MIAAVLSPSLLLLLLLQQLNPGMMQTADLHKYLEKSLEMQQHPAAAAAAAGGLVS
jgi:hypothetical protein